MYRTIFVLLGLILTSLAFSQNRNQLSQDPEDIYFDTASASEYLENLLDRENLWKSNTDSVELSLSRLLNQYHQSYDSVLNQLTRYNFAPHSASREIMYQYDSIPLKWLNDTTAILDTLVLEREPLIYREIIVQTLEDTSRTDPYMVQPAATHKLDSLYGVRDTSLMGFDTLAVSVDTIDTPPVVEEKPRKVVVSADTLSQIIIDTSYLQSNNITLYQLQDGQLYPPVENGRGRRVYLDDDYRNVVVETPVLAWVAEEESPYNIVPGPGMPDSLRAAVFTLLNYTRERDSILISLNDIDGRKIPFWLTNREKQPYRFWVKNFNNDSITVWLGNPSKNDLSMILERDVNFIRLKKVEVNEQPIILKRPNLKMAELKPLEEIPVYWDYGFSTSFSLNQTYLSNWSKGGESSFSNVLDIQGYAEYSDNQAKIKWMNSGRLKLGNIITEEYGLRTNTDMLEFNSQYNKEIRKKMDFSAIFYMKNQIAKGYNYPNDSVVVSRFLNPGTFTIGLGVELKPFENTTLNFSMLSYKNTFVLDTANIDQTNHGIDQDKKARQEMGGQLVIKNSMDIFNELSVTNKIRLFSNYLNKPQNVDVDWEIDLEKKISHYFTILANFHIIYDDDVRFNVYDDNNQPVLLPDGNEKKVAKLQFKQFLGLTFLFKF